MKDSERARLIEELRTICAIPVTPFDEAQRVDWAAYGRVVRHIVAGGVTVLTPNGNTSEFYSLTREECDRAVAVTVGAAAGARGPVLVMPGIGHDIATAVAMAEVAARAGARAVMVHQPVHPFVSEDGWVAYHEAIARAVPTLGVVPYVRDPNVTAAMLSGLAETPNVVGVKYAVPNPVQFASTVAAVGDTVGEDRLTWVCGLAEAWAPFFWPGGATGFTSGLVNVDASHSFEMLRALREGDPAGAMAIWRRVKPFEDLRARRHNAINTSAVKEALAQLDICGPTVRPPLTEVSESEQREIAEILHALDVRCLVPA